MTRTLVIGGGPAGLAAAWAAAQSGQAVTLLDDNPALGGQIWRGDIPARYRRFVEMEIKHGRLAMAENLMLSATDR